MELQPRRPLRRERRRQQRRRQGRQRLQGEPPPGRQLRPPRRRRPGCSTPATAATWRRSPTASPTARPTAAPSATSSAVWRPAAQRRLHPGRQLPVGRRGAAPGLRLVRLPGRRLRRQPAHPNAPINQYLDDINIPGATTQVQGGIKSPSANEYTLGLTKRLGTRGLVRADLVYREWERLLRNRRRTSATGQILPPPASPTSLCWATSRPGIARTYKGIHTQFRYRFNDRLNVAANYTLSETEGNFNGETGPSGPITAGTASYPGILAALSGTRRRRPARRRPAQAARLGDLRHLQHRAQQAQRELAGELHLRPALRAPTPDHRPSPYVANPGYSNPPTSVLTTSRRPTPSTPTTSIARTCRSTTPTCSTPGIGRSSCSSSPRSSTCSRSRGCSIPWAWTATRASLS